MKFSFSFFEQGHCILVIFVETGCLSVKRVNPKSHTDRENRKRVQSLSDNPDINLLDSMRRDCLRKWYFATGAMLRTWRLECHEGGSTPAPVVLYVWVLNPEERVR